MSPSEARDMIDASQEPTLFFWGDPEAILDFSHLRDVARRADREDGFERELPPYEGRAAQEAFPVVHATGHPEINVIREFPRVG